MTSAFPYKGASKLESKLIHITAREMLARMEGGGKGLVNSGGKGLVKKKMGYLFKDNNF